MEIEQKTIKVEINISSLVLIKSVNLAKTIGNTLNGEVIRAMEHLVKTKSLDFDPSKSQNKIWSIKITFNIPSKLFEEISSLGNKHDYSVESIVKEILLSFERVYDVLLKNQKK